MHVMIIVYLYSVLYVFKENNLFENLDRLVNVGLAVLTSKSI